ncbi:hypothetical protein D3C76_1739940 [compost metagenome]
MERMQHHVPFPGDRPTLIPPFRGRELRRVHIEGFAVNPVAVTEVEPMHAVIHPAHVAMIHLAVIHPRHGLMAVLLH